MIEDPHRGEHLNRTFTLDGERQESRANEAKAADCHMKKKTQNSEQNKSLIFSNKHRENVKLFKL